MEIDLLSQGKERGHIIPQDNTTPYSANKTTLLRKKKNEESTNISGEQIETVLRIRIKAPICFFRYVTCQTIYLFHAIFYCFPLVLYVLKRYSIV